MDLSEIPTNELEAMVAKELRRRKSDAILELNKIAEKHGFTLRELFGDDMPRKPRAEGRSKRRPRDGSVSRKILAGLHAGKHPNQIAAELGWSKTGGIYTVAKKYGLNVRDMIAAA